jgi:hypothetical protein
MTWTVWYECGGETRQWYQVFTSEGEAVRCAEWLAGYTEVAGVKVREQGRG